MRRSFLAVLVLGALASGPAFADPDINVQYFSDQTIRVTLVGWYGGAYYQVWRSGERVGPYSPLLSQLTLCTGDCYVGDQDVVPGTTYYYRFVLQPSTGGLLSYGPYAVAVPNAPLIARILPNPSNGGGRLELSLPGSSRYDAPLQTEARLVDLQGRTVAMLFSGPLTRGRTSVAWNGRSDSGQSLAAGVYFLRLSTPLGTSTTRVVRFE